MKETRVIITTQLKVLDDYEPELRLQIKSNLFDSSSVKDEDPTFEQD